MTDALPEKLLESLFDGVYYVNRDRQILFWNSASERITGFGKSDVIGLTCANNILRHIDDAGNELCEQGCPLVETLLDGEGRQANVYLHHKMGHRVPITVRTSAVKDESGKIIGAVEIFRDNSDLIQILKEYERLKQEIYIDELTNVGNRRFGEMNLNTKFFEFNTFNAPFGVVYYDLDHFKNFNDSYGHQTGDDVLIMVSKTVTNIIRKLDILSRWGGEEFVLVSPNIDLDGLKEVAERIRVFIERSFIMIDGKKLNITASIGATLALPEDTSESIIHRADELMYASKTSGRNRVTIG